MTVINHFPWVSSSSVLQYTDYREGGEYQTKKERVQANQSGDERKGGMEGRNKRKRGQREIRYSFVWIHVA